MAQCDRIEIQRRADDELSTGEQTRTGRFRIEHRSGSDQHIAAVFVGDLFDHLVSLPAPSS